MRETWFLLKSGDGEVAWNMALDEALLEAMPRLARPVLRFYGWREPAASFGYFQKHAQIERLTRLRPLVRRPTGGGLVAHDADWTYSLVFPAGSRWHGLTAIESYRSVHAWIQGAFLKLNVPAELAPGCLEELPGQCFAGHEKFDLLWRGKKIAGAAQRRRKEGLLIQGSVQPPPLCLSKTEWQEAFTEVARAEQGIQWAGFEPDGALAERARQLAAQKYSQTAYNEKR